LLRKVVSAVIFIVMMTAACVAGAAATVTKVNWGVDKYNVLRFVIDLSEQTDYEVKLEDKDTLLIRIYGGMGSKVKGSSSVKSDLARSFSVSKKDRLVQVKVPLKKDITSKDFKSFTLKKDKKTGRPDRIVVDVTANKRSYIEPSTKKTTSGRSTQVLAPNYSFRTSGGIRGKNVTLDPGHGGSDPGAIGVGGLQEKKATLAICNYLRQYLSDAGANVSMTRTTDVDVHSRYASARDELQARVNVSNRNRADVFVSIHNNANDNRSVGGIGTYYYPKTQNDYRLARRIQDNMMKSVQLTDFGVRQANFYVVKRSSVPAVLVEVGFISNPREEKLLDTPWFQKTIAKAIANGIAAYFAG